MDESKASEIQRLEAAKDAERKKLYEATGEQNWSSARAATDRLCELDAELVAVRSRPASTNIVGRFNAKG